MPEAQRVKVVCTEPGYENFWIEYDVSTWGLDTYLTIYEDLTINQVLARFIPKHSTGWHIVNGDGTAIAHPGANASDAAWREVWRQFDIKTSRALFSWLWISTMRAIQEAMAMPPKSGADDSGDSAGIQDAAGRDAG